MAEKRFRVLFMIFSESYFATAPFSRKRPEPSTASTLPASGCGERLVPHFDHLELRGLQPSGSKRSPLAPMVPCSVHHCAALAISGSVTSAKAGAPAGSGLPAVFHTSIEPFALLPVIVTLRIPVMVRPRPPSIRVSLVQTRTISVLCPP